MYVNYLNKPKRARLDQEFHGIGESLFENVSWNDDAYNHVTQKRKLPHKLHKFVDKTNLSAEMNFRIGNGKRNTCGCVYRSQFCRLHAVHYTKNDNNCADQSSARHKLATADLKENKRELINHFHSVRKMVDNLDGLRSRLFKQFNGRISRHKASHCQLNQLQKRLVNATRIHTLLNHDVQNNKFSLSPPQFKPNLTNMAHYKDYTNLPSTGNCVVEADVLCSCRSLPGSCSSTKLLQQDCCKFSIRRLLAVHLTSAYSNAALRRRKLYKTSRFPISIPVRLKESVLQWCKSFTQHCGVKTVAVNDTEHEKPSRSVEMYSYYENESKVTEARFDRISDRILRAQDKMLFNASQCNGDVLASVQMNKSHGEGHSVDQSDKTTSSYMAAYQCSSDVSNADHNCFSSFEKRVSSRLKKKRDSGILSPYGEDYIVEVPVVKRAKKVKLCHPYSHLYFWNFYKKLKESEMCKWQTLSKTYFKLCRLTEADVGLYERDLHPWMQESTRLNDVADANTRHQDHQHHIASSSCFYCSASFGGLSLNERSKHIARHSSTSWTSFRAPLYFPNKLVAKQRLNNEKTFKPQSKVTKPPQNPVKPPTKLRCSPVAASHFVKRPTARKSNGRW